MEEDKPIELKTLTPIILFYEDGTAEQLRVPNVLASRDLAQIITRLMEIAQVEPALISYIYDSDSITDDGTRYSVDSLAGKIQFSKPQLVKMAISYLSLASNLLTTFSGKKLEWQRLMAYPMQIFELFFTDKIFRYIDEEAALIKYEDEEIKPKPGNQFEVPQNEFESWCYNYSSMLRMGKTPRGAKELMHLTRGEIAGIVKFWNIAEKKMYPEQEKELTPEEKIKKINEIRKKQSEESRQAQLKAYAEKRAELGFPVDGPPKPPGFRRKKITDNPD